MKASLFEMAPEYWTDRSAAAKRAAPPRLRLLL